MQILIKFVLANKALNKIRVDRLGFCLDVLLLGKVSRSRDIKSGFGRFCIIVLNINFC